MGGLISVSRRVGEVVSQLRRSMVDRQPGPRLSLLKSCSIADRSARIHSSHRLQDGRFEGTEFKEVTSVDCRQA